MVGGVVNHPAAIPELLVIVSGLTTQLSKFIVYRVTRPVISDLYQSASVSCDTISSERITHPLQLTGQIGAVFVASCRARRFWDGAILYENYFNNTQRDSIVTSFSVAKSFDSALIGIAIQEGYIKSVNDPITVYLPELAERDARFEKITIRHLLLMASGLEYKEFRPLLFASGNAA